jgi:5'-methylthioadenosine phosphorylase/purine-nucleoside phosphorylase
MASPAARTAAATRALAVDLTSGAVLAVAARHGVAAACVLAVADRLGACERIGPEALEAAEAELGRVGAAALQLVQKSS